jgi:hypothetical protein
VSELCPKCQTPMVDCAIALYCPNKSCSFFDGPPAKVAISYRSTQFEDGRRNGVKACVEWLHREADRMNDPHARLVLNNAANGVGSDLKMPAGRSRSTDGKADLG